MKFSSVLATFSLLAASLVSGEVVEGKYIVKFHENSRIDFTAHVATINDQLTKSDDNKLLHEYDEVVYGVAAKMDQSTLEKVKSLPNVEQVYPVQKFSVNKIQADAPWGLARVGQREKLNKAPYTYEYYNDGGDDVYVYVLDTGININHKEFQGRAYWGATTGEGWSNEDKHGHGTHCAGTIAGKTFGVAKKARVIAVKVLGDDGYGSDDNVIAGINFAIKDRKDAKRKVLSMSLGGDASEILDKAIENGIRKGLITVVAAGNDNKDACTGSPARSPNAITVGATDVNDKKAWFSNYGKCVDILAPGVAIQSSWIGSLTANKTISGTSMATPHVAGLAATLLSQGIAPKEVERKLKQLGTKGAIQGFDSETVNLFAYNGIKEIQL